MLLQMLRRYSVYLRCLLFVFLYQVGRHGGSALAEQEFVPTITATCKAGYMTIKVSTNQPFVGAVHTKDFRTPGCINYGNGSQIVTLGINLLAPQGAPDYCGVFVNNKTEERSVPVAVRVHRTLELADDKIYVITCGKSGFKNSKNEMSLVSLKVLENDKRVQEVVYGHSYTLRAEISRPDGTHGIRIKSCFAFGKGNRSVPLINERGCPYNSRVITEFKYDEATGRADASLFSMFRLPDSRELHFQCDVAICKGICPEMVCNSEFEPSSQAQSGSKEIYTEGTTTDEGVVPASTTVFVLEPGEVPSSGYLCDDEAGGIRPPWLLYLCIAFGLMFLIMLIINIFLCSAMSCSCARTEVIEKEPSIIEDYDPYRSWHGSQYGSRYSLNGKPGYTSGGSTMNSTRSISTNSDHYAIVHSRPGSRYSPSNAVNKHNHHLRPPPSNLSSHYNGKL